MSALSSPRIRDFPRVGLAVSCGITYAKAYGSPSIGTGRSLARTDRRRVTYRPQTGVPCWLTEPLQALYNRAPVWITKSLRP
jgi:hypothetical protein